MVMQSSAVRIESIEIQNFKNVEHGVLSFENPKERYQASVLGLYGQNGSGKTALIDALALLKYALSGQQVPSDFADYVNVSSDFARIKYEFRVRNKLAGSNYRVIYEVSLRKDAGDDESNISEPYGETSRRATLFDEVLSYSCQSDVEKHRLSRLIDTRDGKELAFGPKTKFKDLVGKDDDATINLVVRKQIAKITSRSFVFSKVLLDRIQQNCKNTSYQFLLNSLNHFGRHELWVVGTPNTGLINMNMQPLLFNYSADAIGDGVAANILLSLNGPTVIPATILPWIQKAVEKTNVVLKQLVPGLTIDVKDLGRQLTPKGEQGAIVQLVSNKNDAEIPLGYESDGIKKLISVLNLLIGIYNNDALTVAVDELDSGIFEYLLGEILRILSEKGKGQLIFTSHNLRPLETIDKGFVAFTTTNPKNRYIRLSNVKATHNLRDFYYRDIVLGGQRESVYEPTNNSEIALAFRKAGMQNAE